MWRARTSVQTPSSSSRRRCVLAVAAAAATAPFVRAQANGETLRFGLTPVFLDERVRVLKQWREHLETSLGRPVEFVQRGTYAQVLDLLGT